MGRKRVKDTDLPTGIRRGKTPGTLEVRVSIPPAPGSTKHRQVTKTIRGGVREAQRVRAELLTSREQRSGSEGTVTQLLRRWLDLVEPDLSPNTMKNYRAYTDRYLIPALGSRQVRRLTTYDLDLFYRTLTTEKGLAPATVRQAHAIMRKALGDAVRQRMIPVNPAVDAKLPKLKERPIDPPSVETYRTILATADRKEGPLGLFVWLAGMTGARRSELCGLKWADIDAGRMEMVIARSIVEMGPGDLREKSTKTDRVRRIAIGQADVALLNRHQADMHARAAKAGVELDPDAYVFTDAPDGSEPWRPARVTLAFRRVCAEAKVSARLHDLRHMHVSLLLSSGTDVRTVAGRVGHANPVMTLNRYGHFMAAADRTAADRMAELLGGGS